MKVEQRESGLLIPVRPPTAEDRRREQARERAEYNRLHDVCPQCGSDDFEVTCMGVTGSKDTNRVNCPCGWKGIVHDMVSRGVQCGVLRVARLEASKDSPFVIMESRDNE